MDLRGVVVTADALHCQRETATWITGRGGDYVMTVEGNQPGLLRILKTLPWKDVPAHTHRQSGHGRRVRRTVRAVTAPGWLQWPAAAQVAQVRRTRTVKGRKHIEVVYVISSVPMVQAQPSVIATWIQGHWAIWGHLPLAGENALHWVRDVVFDWGHLPLAGADHHQLRVGAGPQVMATLRATAISRCASPDGQASLPGYDTTPAAADDPSNSSPPHEPTLPRPCQRASRSNSVPSTLPSRQPGTLAKVGGRALTCSYVCD